MKVDVYDTYARSKYGKSLHFDVLVTVGTHPNRALEYAELWLEAIGEGGHRLDQAKCTFCHTEVADEAIALAIAQTGYFVIPIAGCPPQLMAS